MTAGLVRAKSIVEHLRDGALADLDFHRATKPRLRNVDACLAACKVAWFDAIIVAIQDESDRGGT